MFTNSKQVESRLASLELSVVTLNRTVERLATAVEVVIRQAMDAVIQASLVNRGMGEQAVVHRRMGAVGPAPLQTEIVEKEDTWPPEGFDIESLVEQKNG